MTQTFHQQNDFLQYFQLSYAKRIRCKTPKYDLIIIYIIFNYNIMCVIEIALVKLHGVSVTLVYCAL